MDLLDHFTQFRERVGGSSEIFQEVITLCRLLQYPLQEIIEIGSIQFHEGKGRPGICGGERFINLLKQSELASV